MQVSSDVTHYEIRFAEQEYYREAPFVNTSQRLLTLTHATEQGRNHVLMPFLFNTTHGMKYVSCSTKKKQARLSTSEI